MKIPGQMVWKHQLQNTPRSFAGVQRHMESCFLQTFWKEVRIANIKPFHGMLLEEVGSARVQNVNGPPIREVIGQSRSAGETVVFHCGPRVSDFLKNLWFTIHCKSQSHLQKNKGRGHSVRAKRRREADGGGMG